MSKIESEQKQGFLDLAFAGDEPQDDRGFWNFHHALRLGRCALAFPHNSLGSGACAVS